MNRLLLITILLSQVSCTTDQAQKIGYRTFQNAKEQQCFKELANDCPQGLSFEEYQQERKKL